MNSAAPIQTQDDSICLQPPLPVRRLHNFTYCPRLFYYQWVENLFEENADTIAGSHVHRNVDKPSNYDEDRKTALAEGMAEGARLRSLKLESITLGLVGVVDLIEGDAEGAAVVDYKKGSAKRGANGERVAKESDAVQVMAHALLLEEEGTRVTRGWIYYAEDKRRVPVELTPELRAQTLQALADAKAQAASGHCPPPLVSDPRCLYCSAYPICLPNESRWWAAGFEEKVDEQQMAFVFDGWPERSAVTPDRLGLLGKADGGVRAPEIKEAPRPDGDAGEILVVQQAGAQVGQRGGHVHREHQGRGGAEDAGASTAGDLSVWRGAAHGAGGADGAGAGHRRFLFLPGGPVPGAAAWSADERGGCTDRAV